jgi:hypothetical protein
MLHRGRRPDGCCRGRWCRHHREAAGELGLAGGGQRRAFLMTDADPFDMASSNRVGERIQGVADQSEYLLDADLFEPTDQDVRDRV